MLKWIFFPISLLKASGKARYLFHTDLAVSLHVFNGHMSTSEFLRKISTKICSIMLPAVENLKIQMREQHKCQK